MAAKDVFRDADFASFENHTSGFGSRMLAQMGFKGRLGKHETGRINPVLPSTGRKLEGLATAEERAAKKARTDERSESAQPVSAFSARRGSSSQSTAAQSEPAPPSTLELKTYRSDLPPIRHQPTVVVSDQRPHSAPAQTAAATTTPSAATDGSFTLGAIVLTTSVLSAGDALGKLHKRAWLAAVASFLQCELASAIESADSLTTTLTSATTCAGCLPVWSAMLAEGAAKLLNWQSLHSALCDEESLHWLLADLAATFGHAHANAHSEQLTLLAQASAAVLASSGSESDFETIQQLFATKDEVYQRLVSAHFSPITSTEGFPELLSAAKAARVKVGVLHIGQRARANIDMECTRMRSYAHEYINASSLSTPRRPYSLLHYELLTRLGVSAHETLAIVGNALEALDCHAAGIRTVSLCSLSFSFLHPHVNIAVDAKSSASPARLLSRLLFSASPSPSPSPSPSLSAAAGAGAASAVSFSSLLPSPRVLDVGDQCWAVWSTDSRPYRAVVERVLKPEREHAEHSHQAQNADGLTEQKEKSRASAGSGLAYKQQSAQAPSHKPAQREPVPSTDTAEAQAAAEALSIAAVMGFSADGLMKGMGKSKSAKRRRARNKPDMDGDEDLTDDAMTGGQAQLTGAFAARHQTAAAAAVHLNTMATRHEHANAINGVQYEVRFTDYGNSDVVPSYAVLL